MKIIFYSILLVFVFLTQLCFAQPQKDNMVKPAELNEKILKVANQEIRFKDFSITYIGTTAAEPQPHEPTIGQVECATFIVKDKTGNTQELVVTAGQIPPEPLPFVVNGQKFILLTFETKTGEALYSDYFQIVDSK